MQERLHVCGDARRVAELPIPPDLDLAGGPGGRYYRDITIRRETEWIFAAGLPVYELLTSDRKTYVMQAYSHIVDDSLTLDSLPPWEIACTSRKAGGTARGPEHESHLRLLQPLQRRHYCGERVLAGTQDPPRIQQRHPK